MNYSVWISVGSLAVATISLILARGDKQKEKNLELINYRLDQLDKNVQRILEKLDTYDKEIDEKIEKAIMSHIEVYHKSRRKIND